MNKKILIFAMASDQKEAIRMIGEQMGITTMMVLPRDYHQQIGYLAGITDFKRVVEKYKGPDFKEPMMVLSGMDSKSVDDFLAKCKEAGIRKVNHKAVITPYNASWTPVELAAELEKEHKEMTS